MALPSTNGREPVLSPRGLTSPRAFTGQTTIESKPELVRPLANFPPSIWADCFISFSLENTILKAYAKALEERKEAVRNLIIEATTDATTKLSLIYSVHRLGLSYIYSEEIDAQLDKLFKEIDLKDYEEVDLYTISVQFQVFRHHGYRLSSDVFNKFKDNSSNTFKEYVTRDVKGMLGLYESAYLRLHGEDILDEALEFTETRLKKIVCTLEGNLVRQVNQVLKRPFHNGMPMVEARLYFNTYKEESSSDETILDLAKVHFNYLQLLQKEELRIVSQWWKDMDFQTSVPYVRDRVPEIYLWILGLYLEPCYSKARIIATKITLFLVILDDTYDAYATIDESRLITDAINRWEIGAIDQLPEYIKPFYKILLNVYDELEKEYANEGRAFKVHASKQAFQEIAKAYLEEAEWLHNGYVATFPEYMKNGLITSAYNVISKSALVGMGAIVNEEALAWYETHPKILKASELISRLQDDVMTFQFERKRGQSATGVDAYIKEYNVSEEVAIKEIKKIIENAWKDINEECLKPTVVSMALLTPILNLARMIDVVYKFDDGFTFPGKTLKDYITLLFVTPAPTLTN
ncbi:hypothetical protein OSB04_029282 [Centaurea solstitialis]|uniref:germacrene-A synthase n=1 Tax=Centaurea solstitialis TaxID=347529 RepID=A0AA38SVQ4_9ASTR|nr:hypothetical protein OSB04_029282 [Centaurea solstitialis]